MSERNLTLAIKARDEAAAAFKQVRSDLGGIEKGAKDAGTAASGMGSSISKAAAVAGAAFAAVGVVAFAGKAISAASDTAESWSKVQTVFGDNAGAIDTFSRDAARSLGLSRQAALDASGSFGNMFTQLGISTGAAADMSKGMLQLSADFASFHNADVTEVLAAQTSAFRGEYDALQRFVPTINAAAVQQKALEMTGKAAASALTDQEKALATYQLIQQGAGVATGDFARTQSGLANSLRIIKSSFADVTAELGENLLPLVAPVVSAFAQGLPKAFDITRGALKALTTGEGVDKFYETLITTFGPETAGKIAALADPVFHVRNAIDAALKGDAATALAEFSTAGQEAQKLITAALGGIVDYVRDNAPQLVDKFKEWTAAAWQWVKAAAPVLLREAGAFLSGLLTWLDQHAPELAQKMLSTWLPAALKWIAQAAIDVAKELPGLLVSIGRWIVDEGAPKLVTLAVDLGAAIVRGIVQGIKNVGSAIWDAIKGALPGGAATAALQSVRTASRAFSGAATPMFAVQGAGGAAGLALADSIMVAEAQRAADRHASALAKQQANILRTYREQRTANVLAPFLGLGGQGYAANDIRVTQRLEAIYEGRERAPGGLSAADVQLLVRAIVAELNLTIEMDKQKVGAIVSNQINERGAQQYRAGGFY